MTRKSLITLIFGVGVLVLGIQAALAQSSYSNSMIEARANALGRTFQLGDFAKNNTWQGTLSTDAIGSDKVSMIDARANALGRRFQLGDFAKNNTWQGAASSAATITSENTPGPQSLKTDRNADDVLNLLMAKNGVLDSSLVDALSASSGSVEVSTIDSGTEIEWPQVGIGFGVGILLVLGVGLTMRAAHVRPFAH